MSQPYIRIAHGVRGYFPVLMIYSPEYEGYVPLNSSFFSFRTYEEAIPEAKSWAEAEEVELRLQPPSA